MTPKVPLPVDVFLVIFFYLGFKDILSLRQTSKRFFYLTHLHSVWHLLLRVHVLNNNIPVPGLGDRPIDTLSSEELERYTVRAIRLRLNWTSPDPVPTKRLNIQTIPGNPHARIISLHFLPGRGHRWLLSVTVTTDENSTVTNVRRMLHCWDLEASTPTYVAKLCLPDLRGIAVNTDPSSHAILALQVPHVEIYTIDFSAAKPTEGFVCLSVFRPVLRQLHGFSGSSLLTQNNDRQDIWSVDTPHNVLELQNPELAQPEQLSAAILQNKFAIIIRLTTLELYAIPPLDGESILIPHARPRTLHPTAQHKWQWRIDSVCMSQQASPPSSSSKTLPPINILIRYNSWFPWPINILHHYILLPNTSYLPSEPTSPLNLPYWMTPHLRGTIASPVRLFSVSHMALGRYGTALWIDSHTEDYYGHSDSGQRLAGVLLTPVVSVSGSSAGDNDSAESGGDVSTDVASSVMASATFSVREDDEWVRVALDDGEGRVAVGSKSGEITVSQYY